MSSEGTARPRQPGRQAAARRRRAAGTPGASGGRRRNSTRRSGGETSRLRIGIGVEGRALVAAGSSRPEAGAPHFVRIGLARHPVGEVRHAARMFRRPAAREPRHREVEAPPEEMRRTRLSEKSAAEPLQRHVGNEQGTPKALGDLRHIDALRTVFGERHRHCDFDGNGPDRGLDVEGFEPFHESGVEIGDGMNRGEAHLFAPPVALGDDQSMADEIEIDLKRAARFGDRRGRQSARRQVERDVPPMVLAWGAGEPHLADHLRPHLQRRRSRQPSFDRRFRPKSGRAGPAHAFLPLRSEMTAAASLKAWFAAGTPQ